MASAIDVIHTWASLFEAEFASPASAWVWSLAVGLRRAIATLNVWLAVFLGGFALTLRDVLVADRVAVRWWDAGIVADANTAVRLLFFAELALFATADMLASLDAHPASFALLAFWFLERQTFAITTAVAHCVLRAVFGVAGAADRLVAGDAGPADLARALARYLVALTPAGAVFLDTWASLFSAEVAPVSFCGLWANALLVCAFAYIGA